MEYQHARTGRPSKRASLDERSVALSFRVDPALKNLLLDVSEGSGVSMTEMLAIMLLKEAGYTSLDQYRDTIRGLV